MGKAKTMGALALTALMGMGAAGQMNGTAEARTLDSSASKATKSISKEMVVSTTDDSDGVMSYKDKTSGKSFVSEDNGATWVSEEAYNSSYPAINYEWWTYDEYKVWLEQEKKTLQEMADEHTRVKTSEGTFLWTQELTDQYIDEYEQTLKDIKKRTSCIEVCGWRYRVHDNISFGLGWQHGRLTTIGKNVFLRIY